MKKTDFEPFQVGQVFNRPDNSIKRPAEPVYSEVAIEYPSRLHAMSLDSSQITQNNNLIYTPGHINFCVDSIRHIKVEASASSIEVSSPSKRRSLVMHAAKIMCEALDISHGFRIDITDDIDRPHCGLGSSSGTIAGVAAAINEMYGRPFSPTSLSRYCAQNHGEEIDRDEHHLMPVQCLGGSALCGHLTGGLIIASGQATPIFSHNLDESLSVILGIPADFTPKDSGDLLRAEIQNAEGFRKTGHTYGAAIAYRLVHEVLPGLVEGDLQPCKSLIFDYRWDMGSIKNCSFAYPRVVDIAENLRPLRDDRRVAAISMSSAGPGFFALTKDPDLILGKFDKLGMDTYQLGVHNQTYKIVHTQHA